jgi:hypothetical protein
MSILKDEVDPSLISAKQPILKGIKVLPGENKSGIPIGVDILPEISVSVPKCSARDGPASSPN